MSLKSACDMTVNWVLSIYDSLSQIQDHEDGHIVYYTFDSSMNVTGLKYNPLRIRRVDMYEVCSVYTMRMPILHFRHPKLFLEFPPAANDCLVLSWHNFDSAIYAFIPHYITLASKQSIHTNDTPP